MIFNAFYDLWCKTDLVSLAEVQNLPYKEVVKLHQVFEVYSLEQNQTSCLQKEN